MSTVHGIHHITAIASDPQKIVDFYTNVLGLRLVKKTVNQDDTSTYHLFFGDTTGEPGMDLTFFTFSPTTPGKRGVGQVTLISLAVSDASLEWWVDRLESKSIKHESIVTRFDKRRLVFFDNDNQRLELVGCGEELSLMAGEIWTETVPEPYAIRAFYSARLCVKRLAYVVPILDHVFGYERIEEEGALTLYALPGEARASYLEVETESQEEGLGAAGTVHHIAFAVDSVEQGAKLRNALIELGLYPTDVIDRYYFKSIYFRIPGGILFELATMGPGFTADEKESELGTHLSLPPFLEEQRKEIESGLMKIQ